MTVPAAQWQLDRLSTAAREAAVKASAGAGVSLSSWLATLINETCSTERVASSPEPATIRELARDGRDRMPLQPVTFRATPMVVAPVSAYRPLRMPLKVPEGKS